MAAERERKKEFVEACHNKVFQERQRKTAAERERSKAKTDNAIAIGLAAKHARAERKEETKATVRREEQAAKDYAAKVRYETRPEVRQEGASWFQAQRDQKAEESRQKKEVEKAEVHAARCDPPPPPPYPHPSPASAPRLRSPPLLPASAPRLCSPPLLPASAPRLCSPPLLPASPCGLGSARLTPSRRHSSPQPLMASAASSHCVRRVLVRWERSTARMRSTRHAAFRSMAYMQMASAVKASVEELHQSSKASREQLAEEKRQKALAVRSTLGAERERKRQIDESLKQMKQSKHDEVKTWRVQSQVE